MKSGLAELIDDLTPDVWRQEVGFSADIDACTQLLLSSASEQKKLIGLRNWISKHQPCVFGRLGAAAPDLVEFCILAPNDIGDSDEVVLDKVQDARARWKRRAEAGDKSAFVLVACSPKLVSAAPDDRLQRVAVRLFELYLPEQQVVDVDTLYTDSIVLADDERRSFRKFMVSSDVFAIQGDRRWWNDHRFPGGLAFSFNSPGHMVAACDQRLSLLDAEEAALSEVDFPSQLRRVQRARSDFKKLQLHSVSSVGQVLKLAMNTILSASAAPAGPNYPGWDNAVRLLHRHTGDSCPIAEIDADTKLAKYDFRSYLGWYHTDYTIPSVFFHSANPVRPGELSPYSLDLTYIYDRRASDHRQRMKGVQKRRKSRKR